MDNTTVSRISATESVDTAQYQFTVFAGQKDTSSPGERLDLYANHDRLERTAFIGSDKSLETYWRDVCEAVSGVRPIYYGTQSTSTDAVDRVRQLPGRLRNRVSGTPYTVIGERDGDQLISIGHLPAADGAQVHAAVDTIINETGAQLPPGARSQLPPSYKSAGRE